MYCGVLRQHGERNFHIIIITMLSKFANVLISILIPAMNMEKQSMSPFNTSAFLSYGIPTSLCTPEGFPDFVEVLSPSNRCWECGRVLHNPVQLPCGHLVCEDKCLNELFQDNSERVCEYENCGIVINKKEIFPDASRRRELLNLRVCCGNKKDGCPEQMLWKDLKNHETVCSFRCVPCPNSSQGCIALIPLKHRETHQRDSCLYSLVVCDYCKQQITRKEYQTHIENICQAVLLNCPYNCGLREATRQEYNAHVTQCDLKPQTCSYSCVGCQYNGKQRDVTQHEHSDMAHHIYLIKLYTQTMEEKNQSLLQEIMSLKSQRESWRSTVERLEEELGRLKSELSEAKQMIKELKMKMAAQLEDFIHVERRVEDKADKDIVEREIRSLNALREKLQQLTARLSAIETERAGNSPGVSEQLATLIKSIDQQCSLHDVRLAELDLRFQILETANFEGILMWKIKDFKRRFQEAKSGKTLSLFSQPFYTSKVGYRMCARLYLNGDGVGKGKYLSFFFVIMRGDYDNLLSWPFRHNVSLLLLDQDKRVQNICDTFTPDPHSNSFRKPTSEMNVASGVPCFIDHDKLFKDRTYLHDDTIYLKIKIAC